MTDIEDYVNYPCACGHKEYKKIYCVSHRISGDHTNEWLCQCEKCKTILVFEMIDYNYKTRQFNVVIK